MKNHKKVLFLGEKRPRQGRRHRSNRAFRKNHFGSLGWGYAWDHFGSLGWVWGGVTPGIILGVWGGVTPGIILGVWGGVTLGIILGVWGGVTLGIILGVIWEIISFWVLYGKSLYIGKVFGGLGPCPSIEFRAGSNGDSHYFLEPHIRIKKCWDLFAIL